MVGAAFCLRPDMVDGLGGDDPAAHFLADPAERLLFKLAGAAQLPVAVIAARCRAAAALVRFAPMGMFAENPAAGVAAKTGRRVGH